MALAADSHTAPAPDAGPARPGAVVALSVVIVNWNTRELLRRCLQSIQHAVIGSKFEVVVVDNASSDGSARMVREWFPWARVLENPVNVGFARANNQAYSLTGGRHVLLLNPDTEVQPGALQELVRFMEAHPEVGAAGARLIDLDGSLQQSCHPAPTLARELWRLFHLDALRRSSRYPMERWNLDAPREVEVAQGACLIVRREAVEQGGLLDEDYFIYSEEVDLCTRLRRRGWRVYWVPWAAVVHLGGRSTQQVPIAMFLHLYQGKVLYFRKQHGRRAARLYKLILLGSAVVRVLVSPLAWLERASERRCHLALALNYLRLIRALPSF